MCIWTSRLDNDGHFVSASICRLHMPCLCFVFFSKNLDKAYQQTFDRNRIYIRWDISNIVVEWLIVTTREIFMRDLGQNTHMEKGTFMWLKSSQSVGKNSDLIRIWISMNIERIQGHLNICTHIISIRWISRQHMQNEGHFALVSMC